MKKEYVILSKSWYAEANIESIKRRNETCYDDITFGDEFHMRFHDLKGSCGKLEIFDDQFSKLPEIQDVLDELVNYKDLTPAKFAEILDNLGYKDVTPIRQIT